MSDETTFPALIRDYAEAGRIDLIISLCEAMKGQRDRAERRIEMLTHNIAKLNEAFRNITEPATGRKLSEPAAKPDHKPKSNTQKVDAAPQKKGPDVSDFTF